MRPLLAAALLALAAACAREKVSEFELGLIGPVGPGVARAARAAGMTIREAPSEGADSASAGEGRVADWSALRLAAARAVVRGRRGVFFVLPAAPEGKELTDLPEEWQALDRAAREIAALLPVIESGVPSDDPFPLPEGVEGRAWRFRGRLYFLLVNDAAAAAPLPPDALKPWRALFEVRADARDVLSPCAGGLCLPPGRVLWLEGRL